MRFAGLTSGAGSNLLALAGDDRGGELAVVVVDDPDAGVLPEARRRDVPTEVVGGETTREAVRDAVAEYDVELVCLDGWDPELSETTVEDGPPVLAVEWTLSPSGGGDPVAEAVESGVRIAGCTVRVVGADPGIVAQEPVPAYGDDDVETLRDRIGEAVPVAYRRAVGAFAEGRASIEDDEVAVTDRSGQFPDRWLATADRERELRYGENPHQDGALYRRDSTDPAVVGARQLNEGAKALSYNNYSDADAALQLILEFDRPAAAVIKHANPAGCATARTIGEAYDRALSTDPMSAFGGIVALNRECDPRTAEAITDSFKEVVVAPSYTEKALEVLFEKENLRVLAVGDLPDPAERAPAVVERPIAGGRLLQERDDRRLAEEDLEVVTERVPTDDQVASMRFAWQTVKHVRSNAIVFATDTETVGVGAGQMSRVDAVRIAATKAEEHAEGKSAEGAVMASDAFFPFPDGVERAAEAGIEAIVQPGGSVNDEDVVAAADDLGLAMAFTGTRAFRHG